MGEQCPCWGRGCPRWGGGRGWSLSLPHILPLAGTAKPRQLRAAPARVVGPALLCCSRDPSCQFQGVPGPGGPFPAVRLCNSYWRREVQGRERRGPEDVAGWPGDSSFLPFCCGGPHRGLKGRLDTEHDSQPRGVKFSPSRHPQMLPSAVAGSDLKVEMTQRK